MASDPRTPIPIEFPPHTRAHRKLDERLWARFPILARISTAGVLALPLGSRLRRRMVAYWVYRSWEIVNRRDFELALAAQDPEVKISYASDPEGRIPPDLVGELRGEEGFRRGWQGWLDAFEDFRNEPQWVIDLGDNRLLVALRSVGRGIGSGVVTEAEGYVLYTFRRGRVAEHKFFFDRGEAERAARR